MSELSTRITQGATGRTISQSDRRKIKYAFLLRSGVLLAVIIVFYLKAITSQAETEFHADNYLSPTQHGRQLLTDNLFNSRPLDAVEEDFLARHDVARARNDIDANCTPASILQFPSDGLTRVQRQHGWIVCHSLVAFYSFWLLAIICYDYFVPAIEKICLTVRMQNDVVGATLMAAATSTPELFMNCVGTFVTMGDIGASTIVGSAIFNVLAVPACCGIFVGHCVRLHWWPVTRDCLMYCVAVLVLTASLSDWLIMWYEALAMVLLYILYIVALCYNDSMARGAGKLILKFRRDGGAFREVSELTPILAGSKLSTTSTFKCDVDIETNGGIVDCDALVNFARADSPWIRGRRGFCTWALRWPITLLLWLTIPDSQKHPDWRHLTLVLSVAWIGALSFLVAFAITAIGDTLNVPDSVMGLTILAAGMSVPEAVSSIIVSRKGQGAMAISNSLGSNTFGILLSLGVPWFVKAYFLPTKHGENWVSLGSAGLAYSTVFLLSTILGLYLAFLSSRFVLNLRIGVACAIMYVVFILVASMIELNVFFPVNLAMCRHS